MNVYIPQRNGRGAAFAVAIVASVVLRSLAAGATWRLVIASAPWAARSAHMSVIDAAGAIYVIGGWRSYKDVWVSTDGGARPDS
jgi:hypothetical protein